MIVSKKQYDRDAKRMENEIRRIDERYWDLWHRHDRLLRYLGLEEKEVEPSIEIVKKRK